MKTTPAKVIILTLPLPPSINRQKRNRWAMQALKDEWAINSWAAWAKAGRPFFERVIVTPVICFGSARAHDIDNYTGGMAWKGIWDGLKGNLMPDDNIKHLRIAEAIISAIDSKNPRLELHVRKDYQ